ncbi:hypothetical protein [Acinetobacter radioresistens]|uniref:hypothetical protein n=1 Tax=Acinetobacter radioresistens TaxID=40216 RepID=UPI001250C711|nr:hypothetical protein [Acinetobacter radioresistens]
MITVQLCLCGFGLKHKWEFGDPRRSPITVLELGIMKICKMRGDSKLVEFMRGYCDNDEFDWHPKVRLAQKKAIKKARSYYEKYYREQVERMGENYQAQYFKNSELRQENAALLKVIELKRGAND